MIAWLAAVPVLLVAVGITVLPGLLLAWSLGLRGLTLVAGAIAASFVVIALSTLVLPLFGLSWGPLPVLVVGVVLGAIPLPLRRFLSPRQRPPRAMQLRSAAAICGGVGLAAILIGGFLATAIDDPSHISQSFDAVFHLNAAAHILLSGSASPLDFNVSAAGAAGSFYPTVWHATVALVAQLSGASVPVATNIFAIVVAAWIWPVTIVFFARPFLGRRPAHLLLAAVVAAAFNAFPYLLMTWGVLYPNLLSTALVPAALGFLHLALRPATPGNSAPTASLWIAAAGATGAATLSHPNALPALAILAAPLLAATAFRVFRSDLSSAAKLVRLIPLGIGIAAPIVLWRYLQTSEARAYDDISFIRALELALTNGPFVGGRAWFVTVLVLAGALALLLRRSHRWLLGSYAIAVALFIVAIGFTGPVRDFITGPWYSDAARLAALIPIVAVPLAAVTAAWLYDSAVDGMGRFAPQLRQRTQRLLPALGGAVVVVLVAAGGASPALAAQKGWLSDLHAVPEAGALLSTDETVLLERLDKIVPEGDIVAGDPWSGAGLVLALSGRPTVFGHLQGNYSENANILRARFADLPKPEACTLLTDLNVDFMLDFGDQLYAGGTDELRAPFIGLRDLSRSPALTPVDQEGTAVLYRVDCGA
ncbi:DUF6541 family protein [Leucobacter chironomi]|uniref:DUF6541 family protein n=1 Tax=Leucobacter chironomi TaxID=491918 RepID=UPI0004624E45|nr:DUF6541 family protein [Leucobacter chironomi]